MSPPSLLQRAQSAAGRLPASTRGALWMTAGAALMAALTAMIRHASAGLHPFEVVFFRNLFGFAFMLPWLIHTGRWPARTRRLGLYGVRALVGVVAMLCWFYALSVTPLADAVGLSFTSPLFATAGAALVLREDVRVRRWTATAVGFVGAMVILRPGFGSVHLVPAALVLVSSAALAGTALMIKELSRTEPANAIVAYMGMLMTPLTLGPALFVWRTPDAAELAWLVALAAVATLGNHAVTRAFAAAEASAVMPYDFVRLPFAALIGFAAFSEVPDPWTWAGAAVIAASSLYIAHREARLERAGRSRPGAPPAAAGGPPADAGGP